MTSKVSTILNKIHDVNEVNSLLVSAYLGINKYTIENHSLLEKYILTQSFYDKDKYERLLEFEDAIIKSYGRFSLEMLIEFFEFVVSPSDKVVTGAIYTPHNIRGAIIDHVFHQLEGRDYAAIRIADIACGCGGFFLTICEKLLSITDLSCHYICEHILHGCDIAGYCIERCKILLALKALENGERTDDLVFNLYQGNSLVFDWRVIIQGFTGFDAVVGNPPYVTAAKMDSETRSLLSNWRVSSFGKADLYIPFFQIAIELLNDTGIMGYITVSNFYRSLNGKALREYFAENRLNITIVDFGGEQVFKGCSTYTCLFFADRQHEGVVRYIRVSSDEVSIVHSLPFVEADYEDLDATKGWVIKDGNLKAILQRIANAGIPLGEMVDISNGLATLKNDLYILNVVDETEQVFIHEYDGRRYPIERSICRLVVKPSTMDVSMPLDQQTRWIIFPYESSGRTITCYNEDRMQKEFPHTLAYLRVIRGTLDKRDKGKREYEQWYAYGRSQAINIPGHRLLMPYIADKPTFMLSDIDGLLFFNGFALVCNDMLVLERLNKVLNTDIFWFYVENISKPYANGFYSMGKRYIRYFGIPYFNKKQLVELDAAFKKEDIEDILYPCYFGSNEEQARQIISDYLKKQ